MTMHAAIAGPAETLWDEDNDLLDEKYCQKLTLEYCNLDYWFEHVARGATQGLINGHRAQAPIPLHMRQPGPLCTALLEEYAYRARSEEIATRGLSNLIFCAPTAADAEFFATLVIDEARHARIFKAHMVELGVERARIDEYIGQAVRDSALSIAPLEQWALGIVRERMDYYGGVAITTIIIEGALASLSVLSERKWKLLDPAGADIGRGAALDEIRHLSVGANIVKQHLQDKPHEKARLVQLLQEGAAIWQSLEQDTRLLRREEIFQNGIADYQELLADYELLPGRRLLDTTPHERLGIAARWSDAMRRQRLTYMGLAEADAAWLPTQS